MASKNISRVIIDTADASKDMFIPSVVANHLYNSGVLSKAVIEGFYAGSYMISQRQINGMSSVMAVLRSEAISIGRCR